VIIGPVYRLTLRALLLQRRTILLALLAAAPVVVALVYAVAAKAGAHHFRFYSHLVQDLFVPTIASVVALVIGVSAIGDEREDGTIYYLVATPQSRLGLIATKIAAAIEKCEAATDPGMQSGAGRPRDAVLPSPTLATRLTGVSLHGCGQTRNATITGRPGTNRSV
jgi:hypothetical protein